MFHKRKIQKEPFRFFFLVFFLVFFPLCLFAKTKAWDAFLKNALEEDPWYQKLKNAHGLVVTVTYNDNLEEDTAGSLSFVSTKFPLRLRLNILPPQKFPYIDDPDGVIKYKAVLRHELVHVMQVYNLWVYRNRDRLGLSKKKYIIDPFRISLYAIRKGDTFIGAECEAFMYQALAGGGEDAIFYAYGHYKALRETRWYWENQEGRAYMDGLYKKVVKYTDKSLEDYKDATDYAELEKQDNHFQQYEKKLRNQTKRGRR